MFSHFGLLLAFGLEVNAQCTPAIVESVNRVCDPSLGQFMLDFELSNSQGALAIYDIATSNEVPIQDVGRVGEVIIGPYTLGNSEPLLLLRHQDSSCDFIIDNTALISLNCNNNQFKHTKWNKYKFNYI